MKTRLVILALVAVSLLLIPVSLWAQTGNVIAPNDYGPALTKQAHSVWITVPISADYATNSTKGLQAFTATSPVFGYVMVTATGTLNYTHVNGTQSSFCLQLSQTKGYVRGCVPDSGTDASIRGTVPAAAATDVTGYGAGHPYSIVKIWPVTAGASYTFWLNGTVKGMATGGNFLFHPTITVLFVPSYL